MHIIHHLDGRELLFVLPMSDHDVFHIVEEKVYRVIGAMLAGGFPIIEFVGGRKNKDSLMTKLLSKQDTIAAQVFDKLRFRVVTRTRDDIFPVLQYLTKKLFPFNYVVPVRASTRSSGSGPTSRRRRSSRSLDADAGAQWAQDEFTPSDNQFSAESYRIIHFVVDMPSACPSEFSTGHRRARDLSATSSSSSASSRSSTATPKHPTRLATRRTPSTRSGKRRRSCAAFSLAEPARRRREKSRRKTCGERSKRV
jgi:uncharacterized protein (TIGR04552 family)